MTIVVTPAMFPQTPTQAVVPRLWPGSTVVVIGGGHTLTREDVEYCRGKARVIVIKEAYLLAPWADAIFAADAKWWRGENGAPTFTGLKYAIEQDSDQVPAGWNNAWPDLQVLRNTGMEGLELDPSGLRTGQNSGMQAVNLAVHFGASRVLLLGFNMWPGADGRQNWFDASMAKSHHSTSPYAMFLHFFATMVAPLKAVNVEVINCTAGYSALGCFPKALLQDVLT